MAERDPSVDPKVEVDRLIANNNFMKLPREISLYAEASEVASLRARNATDRILNELSECPIVFVYGLDDLPLVTRLRENNWKGWVALIDRTLNPLYGTTKEALNTRDIPFIEICNEFSGHLRDSPELNPFRISSRRLGTSTGSVHSDPSGPSGPSHGDSSSNRELVNTDAPNIATQSHALTQQGQGQVLDIEMHPVIVEANRRIQESTLFQLPLDIASFAVDTETASNAAKVATDMIIKRLSKCPAVFVYGEEDLPLLLRLRGENWKGWAALIAKPSNGSPKTILHENDIPYFEIQSSFAGHLRNSPELNPFTIAGGLVGTSSGSGFPTPTIEDIQMMLDVDVLTDPPITTTEPPTHTLDMGSSHANAELIDSPTTTTQPLTHTLDIGTSMAPHTFIHTLNIGGNPINFRSLSFDIPIRPTFNRYGLSPEALTLVFTEAMNTAGTHSNSRLSPYSLPFGVHESPPPSGFNVSPQAIPEMDNYEPGHSVFNPSSFEELISVTNSVTSTSVLRRRNRDEIAGAAEDDQSEEGQVAERDQRTRLH